VTSLSRQFNDDSIAFERSVDRSVACDDTEVSLTELRANAKAKATKTTIKAIEDVDDDEQTRLMVRIHAWDDAWRGDLGERIAL